MAVCVLLFLDTPLVTSFCSGPRLIPLTHCLFVKFLVSDSTATRGTILFGGLVMGRGTVSRVVTLALSKVVNMVVTFGKVAC